MRISINLIFVLCIAANCQQDDFGGDGIGLLNNGMGLFGIANESSLLDRLVSAAAQVTPLGPGLLRAAIGQPAKDGQEEGGKQDECAEFKEEAFAIIENAFKDSECYTGGVQSGSVDFGFLGTEDETDDCGGQNCAYTNPNSPYGLVVLPFNKDEDPNKATSDLTPEFVKEDIQQRNGENKGTEEADRSIFSGLGIGQLFDRQQQQQQQQKQQSSNSDEGFGKSASFQLHGEEVVVVAGCTPSASESRYWSWLPYTHLAWHEQRSSFVTVFASMSDAVGTYQAPLKDGGLSGQMHRNRLNSTLPSIIRAVDGDSDDVQELPSKDASTGASTLFQDLRDLARDEFSGSSSKEGEVSGSDPDDASSQFSIVIMTASKAAANKVIGILEPRLQSLELIPRNPTKVEPQRAPQGDEYASSDIVMTGSYLTPINVLPIPRPFVQGIGLNSTSPYFMLIARSIVPSGQLDQFARFAQGHPLHAWRLTPSSKAPPSTCPNLLNEWKDDSEDTFPLPEVISRFPGVSSPKSSATGKAPDSGLDINADTLSKPETQDERWLEPAMDWLMDALEKELEGSKDHPSGSAGVWPKNRGHAAVYWGLGSDHALGAAKIDWGLQCYSRRVEFCNGDNRDAQYVASLPMVTLTRPSKVLYLVGVNHAVTGLSAYANIAPSDPIQRLGLQSWTDLEMRGSADSLMSKGPYKDLSKFFFLVAFSRDCSGIPYCKVVPPEGARSLPAARAALIMLRAYVNPQTGVGPDMERMVRFREVAAVPASMAYPTDYQQRYPAELFANNPCKPSMIAATLSCALDLSSPILQASNSTEGGEVGIPLLHTINALRRRPGKACCQALLDWDQNGCWCDDAGQKLLRALVPVGSSAMVMGMMSLCGQSINATGIACTLAFPNP